MNLKGLRERNKISQIELADKIGVAQNTICQWETGARRPNLDMLVRLTEVFGCTADELLGIARKPAAERDVPACVRDTMAAEETDADEEAEEPEEEQPETRSEQIAVNMSAAFAETIRRRTEEAAKRTAG